MNGVPREDGFIITVASEVMAILCLAADLNDLKYRLGRILVAYTIATAEGTTTFGVAALAVSTCDGSDYTSGDIGITSIAIIIEHINILTATDT